MIRSLLVMLATVIFMGESAAGASIVVPVSEDAAILNRIGSPGVAASNFGIFNYLYAGSYDPDVFSYSRSLMKFVLPLPAAGETLESATMRLVVGQEFPQTKVFDFFRVDDNWSEGGVTWLSAPQPQPLQSPMASFDSAIGLGAGPPPRNTLTFDITAAVEDELSTDATRTLSILWKEHDESGACCNRLDAYSKELAVLSTNVPQIILSFVPEPSVAAHLAMLMIMPLVRRSSRRKL